MNQTNVNHILWEKLIISSTANELSSVVSDAISNCDGKDIADLLDAIIKIEIPNSKLKAIIDVIESLYIKGCELDTTPYLAALYYRAGNIPLSKYYIGLLNNCPESLAEELKAVINTFSIEPKIKINKKLVSNYDFETSYEYEGQAKAYSIYSFSKTIGKNATVLKTPYGAVLFDCGAACGQQSTDIITGIELLEFFKKIDISPTDIVAVVISHAHLDHYGSLSTLINIGININNIYIEDDTKALISQVDTELPSIDGVLPVNAFFFPNQKIKIVSFKNGHILGSSGYIVSFDERNIIYTGDYCLHDQTTVPGLNVRKLLQNNLIDMYGVDCLITETTYGKRAAPIEYIDVAAVFQHFVNLLLANGFKVFIPSFAIGRSQEIALLLNESNSVLIDGLAAKISHIYENISGVKIFNGNTRYNDSLEDNKEDNFDCNDIIIASSGMLSKDSTSYNYVKNFLSSDRKIAIIKTGYISSESYGNELLNQWKGENCRLFDISLSAHADYNEISTLIEALEPNHIVCIHGDGLMANESNIDNIISSDSNKNESTSLEEKNDMTDSDNSEPETVKTTKPPVVPNEVYKEIIFELNNNNSSELLELIAEFIKYYDEDPSENKRLINKNSKAVKSYYELYCYLRMNEKYKALYKSVKMVGPKKPKQAKHFKKIIKLFNQEDFLAEEIDKNKDDNLSLDWHSTDALYIKSSNCNCITEEHIIIQKEVEMLTVKNAAITTVKVIINCCNDCKNFFIEYEEYKKHIQKNGILIGNYIIDEDISNKVNDTKQLFLNPLFFSGYALETPKGGLKPSLRRLLIRELINTNIMGKNEIIRMLKQYKEIEPNFTIRFQINDDLRYINGLE